MTVRQIVDELGFSVFTKANEEKVLGIYCCDLLSNALVKLRKQHAWLTVMNNVNVAAVAHNNGAACVILTEGIRPDEQFLIKANKFGIVVLGSDLPTYETAKKLNCIAQQFFVTNVDFFRKNTTNNCIDIIDL